MNRKKNKREFKRVPAVDKCFSVLDLFARSCGPLYISEIARNLNYNKSTVYNLVHTLSALEVLERSPENKFGFGTKFYTLGKCSCNRSNLISTVRPFLEEFNRETRLTVFLGIRSDASALILDKVDSPDEIRVSSETGMRIPLLRGAAGKVLLAQLPEAELDRFFSDSERDTATLGARLERQSRQDLIRRVQRQGFAFDDGDHIQGVRSIAVPLNIGREDLQAALWAVGLGNRMRDNFPLSYVSLMKRIARKIETRFSMI
ncbi:MAG: IclR family transcriptional regulator [Deltaproteobacteria bacterium]|nr:IclR family transcriptional regulator [Deltaproteobacteria bacterium]